MDPLTFYQIGLVRHQELLREAAEHRMWSSVPASGGVWQRVRAMLTRFQNSAAEPHREPVAANR